MTCFTLLCCLFVVFACVVLPLFLFVWLYVCFAFVCFFVCLFVCIRVLVCLLLPIVGGLSKKVG